MGIRPFQEFYEEALLEAGGSLKEIPKAFKHYLTKKGQEGLGWTGVPFAGKNSKVEIYKKNAKLNDLIKAVKEISGTLYVNKSAKWSLRRDSSADAAIETKHKHAGVLVKVNGEWAFMVSAQYSFGRFLVLSATGELSSKKDMRKEYGKRNSWEEYDRTDLTAAEIGDIIDFKNDKVDVYVVTIDEKYRKQIER